MKLLALSFAHRWSCLKKKRINSAIDVLTHALVPEMKILSNTDKSKLFTKFSIDDKSLPRMLSGDPSAVALKANVGDVIQIKRNDGTGNYLTYRIVVEA